MSQKILLLASQHGNELLGEQLYERIQLLYPEYLPQIDFMIANPRAHHRGVRSIDTDLNRSYKTPAVSYEERRATEIRHYIEKTNPVAILDLHTTTCDQAPCFIVAAVNDKTKAVLRAFPIKRVVLMSHDIVKHSLIGNFDQSVSIEVSVKQIDKNMLDDLSKGAIHLIEGVDEHRSKQLFEVKELLLRSEVRIEDQALLANFKKSSAGFYPILAGEEAYKTTPYLGFKSKTCRTITL